MMKDPAPSPDPWSACHQWLSDSGARTWEITLLDIPERRLDEILSCIRSEASIVAVMGRDGPELFAELNWMDDDDEDLIWSTFFMVVLDELRIQHSLAPSRPVKPGPWMSLGAGRYDLELAIWPDEIFGTQVQEHEKKRRFERVLSYARTVSEVGEAGTLVLTHGCFEDPRVLAERGDERLIVLT